VMKKLNDTNYVVQRSYRSRSFVVHGDRLKPYKAEIEDGSWPASFLDAAQRAQDANQLHDPDSDGQQQQAVEHRRPGRSRGRRPLTFGQTTGPTEGDHIATHPTSSPRQQQPSCIASVPPVGTLTYSDNPSPRQQATGDSNCPITDLAPRRSGRKCRLPAKLRRLASSRRAAPGKYSRASNSVSFVDNFESPESELCFESEHNRLSSTSSSDSNFDELSDSSEMDYSQHSDVRYLSATSSIEPSRQHLQQS